MSHTNETSDEGTTPAFKPILPDTDEVLPAAQHFAIALASLKVVSARCFNTGSQQRNML